MKIYLAGAPGIKSRERERERERERGRRFYTIVYFLFGILFRINLMFLLLLN
jgi:predicted nucleic acid-binding Zn ribbon protein